MTFRINVRTINNNTIHFSKVKQYEVEDGFLVFTDDKSGRVKRFPAMNCEIEEEGEVK